jgi:hypothetical protein
MKILVFALALFTNGLVLNAQSWVDFGVKGQWGPTLLLNKAVFDDSNINHQLKTKGGFGAKIGFNFNDMHEVTFDFMASGFQQDFVYSIADTSDNSRANYNSGIEFRSLDFMLMYRNNKDGTYFEVGPVISSIKSASRFDDFKIPSTDLNFDTDQLTSMQTGLALGFGSYIMGTDNFGITAGFRMSYMFSDLISSSGQVMNYPQGPNVVVDSYAPSHPLYVQLIFEANFDLAYMARANCGRTKLMMFN